MKIQLDVGARMPVCGAQDARPEPERDQIQFQTAFLYRRRFRVISQHADSVHQVATGSIHNSRADWTGNARYIGVNGAPNNRGIIVDMNLPVEIGRKRRCRLYLTYETKYEDQSKYDPWQSSFHKIHASLRSSV